MNKKSPAPVVYTPEEIAEFERNHPGELFRPTQAAAGGSDALEELLDGGQAKPPTPAPAPTQKPAGEPEPRMLTRYEFIEQEIRRKETTNRLGLALGLSTNDKEAMQVAFRFMTGVLSEIKKTETLAGEHDDKKLKKDLTFCSIDSIISAMLDAASFKLPIDGRQLAFIVRYGNAASFMPGYKGFVYKIAEHYKDVDFTAEPVFEGDELTLSDKGGFQTYVHMRKDPFQNDPKKMIGLITCLSYSDGAGRHSKIATLPKSEIDQIRGAAKQDFIWKAWFFEKAKGAGLKRLCKIHFATVMGVQELMAYDNAHHYLLDTPNGDKIAPSSGEDLAKRLLEHKPVDVIPMPILTEKEKVTNERKEMQGGEEVRASNIDRMAGQAPGRIIENQSAHGNESPDDNPRGVSPD